MSRHIPIIFLCCREKVDYLQISADLFNMVRDINKRIEPVLLRRANDKSGFLESVLKQEKVVYKAAQ